MKSTLIDNCTLLLWVSLMASSFVVSEQLIPYVNPIASTALRFLLATILMMPFIGKTSIQRLNYKILFHYSVISLFLVLFFIGVSWESANKFQKRVCRSFEIRKFNMLFEMP